MKNSKGVRVWFCKAEGYEEVTDDQEYADKAYPLPGECEQGIAFTDAELESLITDAFNAGRAGDVEAGECIKCGSWNKYKFLTPADYIKSKEKSRNES